MLCLYTWNRFLVFSNNLIFLQNEDRTLWEATSTYVEMSPFMSANKIKKPILLIHGEQDNNSGTLTMQVKSYATSLLIAYENITLWESVRTLLPLPTIYDV